MDLRAATLPRWLRTAQRIRHGLRSGAPKRMRAALFFALCGCAVPLAAQTPAAQPYQVEAVFLFNFTQFVSWPADAFAHPTDPVVICILGDDPFGNYLDATLSGEQVDTRPLTIRRYSRLEELGDCHILFVSRSEAGRLDAIFMRLRGHSTLTVSDAEDFGRRGGMIRFVIEDQRIKLRINLAAARAARLTISSKLLRIAEILNGSEP